MYIQLLYIARRRRALDHKNYYTVTKTVARGQSAIVNCSERIVFGMPVLSGACF